MSEENKPFYDEEGEFEEHLITEAMVKKATYLIHKLADRRGADFKEIQKKCKKALGYENLAKVTLEEGHTIIDKLIELTGGEEEVKPEQDPKADDGSVSRDDLSSPADLSETKELEAEIDKLADMLQICVSDSREIVYDELGKENITEGTRAMLVKSFAATLFIEASKRGLGR